MTVRCDDLIMEVQLGGMYSMSLGVHGSGRRTGAGSCQPQIPIRTYLPDSLPDHLPSFRFLHESSVTDHQKNTYMTSVPVPGSLGNLGAWNM